MIEFIQYIFVILLLNRAIILSNNTNYFKIYYIFKFLNDTYLNSYSEAEYFSDYFKIYLFSKCFISTT